MSRSGQMPKGPISRWTSQFWTVVLIIAFLPVIIGLAVQALHMLVVPVLVIVGLVIVLRLCLLGWHRRQDW